MRKFLHYLSFALLLCSCSGGDSNIDTPSIEIDVSEISLPNSNAGASTVKFRSSTHWTASVSQAHGKDNWIDVSPKSGGAGEALLTITVIANSSSEVQKAQVKISSGNISKTINVNQPGAAPELSLDKYVINLAADDDEFNVALITNGPWKASNIPDWILLTPTSGTLGGIIRGSVQKNEDQATRIATINFENGTASSQLQLTQSGSSPSLIISPSEMQTVSATGGVVSVSVNSNEAWTVSSDRSWASVSSSNGSGGGTVEITVAPNSTIKDDIAAITFASPNLSPVVLKIKRNGADPSLSITPSEVQNVSFNGGNIIVTISSNSSWTAVSNQLWATIGTAAGQGNGSSIITIAPNTSTVSDHAVIAFEAENASPVILTINRAGIDPIIAIDKSNLQVDAASGNFDISLVSNAPWRSSDVPTWMSLSPTNGTGDTNIHATYMENTSTSPRTAIITFANSSATKKLTLTQSGATPYLSISPFTDQTIGAVGGQIPITITSNTTWSIVSDQTWAIVGTANGSGPGATTISVAANTSLNATRAVITFSTPGLDPILLVINRSGAAPTFELDKTTLSVGATAANYNIQVTSNGEWSASCSASWVTISPSTGIGNKSVVVSCAANLSLEGRTTTIQFTHNGATQIVTVNQNRVSGSLSINPDAVPKISAGGSSFLVAINTNTSWTASSNQSWVIIETTSGSGNSSTTIRVAANNSKSDRKAVITFTSGGNTVMLDINQTFSQLDDFDHEEL